MLCPKCKCLMTRDESVAWQIEQGERGFLRRGRPVQSGGIYEAHLFSKFPHRFFCHVCSEKWEVTTTAETTETFVRMRGES